MNDSKKLAYFLPNTFTALNMACGFASIMLSLQGEFFVACMVLILGAVFDSVDGRVARLTGTQSPFGEQFDSLSDLISFGMAPAMLMYQKYFVFLGRPGMVICFFFLLCGALRLARFNASIEVVDSSFFQGLPIPGAASAIIGYVLLSIEFNVLNQYPLIVGAYMIFYSLLMISNIGFCSFKNTKLAKKHKKGVLVIIFMIMILGFIYEKIIIGAVISVYVIGSILYHFTHNGKLAEILLWKNDKEYEED